MATLQANSFALLNDEDSGDVSKLLEPVIKAKAKERQKKKGQNGRADNGIGRGGKGLGSMSSVNEVDKKVSCRPIGQHGQGGYKQGYTRFQNERGDSNHTVRADGYQLSYGSNNGNKDHTANGENGCAGKEGNVPASRTEVAKDAEHEERKRQQEEREKQRREEYEKEKKKMTLEQYEKIHVEKRKALEALKSEERKVTLDKELKSLIVVRKNKEDDDVLIKLNSEKDKLKRGSSDKEEKGRKAVSINEFFNPARGQFNRRGPRRSTVVENVAATPAIEDLGQFPVLGSSN